ncbi:MAG: prenyltransferase/squalene oxidase repeat-containing protein [Solirubrobacteraceae bacterium]
MRTSIAALTITSLLSILTVAVAQATPTQVTVRIEGKTETLFEGPIWTEGHDVLASSDTKARPCDGINPLDPQNKTPGPTPTAASVDAMSIIGETFDGQWYPGYNDYFITRWGPDLQAGGMSWGVLVNNVFTDVGGCQYELSAGDEGLWAYNAFGGKPYLALFAVDASYTSGTRPLTATAELGKPFEVEVVNYSDDKEDNPPASPERTGSAPFAGADVSPVKTSAKGFEKVEVESPRTVKTNAQGKATLVFQTTGWHRIKATASSEGIENVIRSNRLDVCVPPSGATGCGEPPPEDHVRTPRAPGAVLSAPDNERNQARLDSTVRFLQEVQNPDGGFGGVKGGESDTDFSAWVALALAAAGIDPQCQKQPGGVDAYTYLIEHASELRLTTEFERVLLVADASGASPQDFGGVNLVSEILKRQLSGAGKAGAFPHEAGGQAPGVNDTIFAILALSPVHEPAAQEAVQRAASWLEAEQYPDGSWPSVQPYGEAGEVDMTGAAIEALNAAGRHTEAQTRAFKYLREAQNPDGGFPEILGRGEESNVASTAWAVQSLWSAGQNPETWVQTQGQLESEPLGYMASLQHEDGSIQWKASSNANPVWMTAYVAPTFAGQFLPIPAVPPCIQSPSTPPGPGSATPPAPGSAEPGQGGESSQPGSGVIAGGGGQGAALFSRPQPQSQGKTPGGVRLLSSKHTRKHHKSAVKHHRNPGVRRRPAPATTAAVTGAGRSLPTAESSEQAGGQVVKGALIATPAVASAQSALEPGAPGLHSAGAGGNETPWLAIGIGALVGLLILAGSQLERRRPQVIL